MFMQRVPLQFTLAREESEDEALKVEGTNLLIGEGGG